MGIDGKKYDIKIGDMPRGERNLITDVPGVKVGHVTLNNGSVKTGVTAILPHGGNIFKEKVLASSCVINGFGKTAGLVQVEELGTIETPIILTNTLSVGTCYTGLVQYMLEQNDDIGLKTGTVNPLICECNDGNLNDIRGLHVEENHVLEAIERACEDFEEGAVGGGTGMRCYGLKGGIGSASRLIELDGTTYTVGALMMSNFGSPTQLLVDGEKVGEKIKALETNEDKGSVIIILATDIPLNERQLKRMCKRSGAGLARTGSYYGNGSGDIAIGFTTANRVPHYRNRDIMDVKMLHEDKIDLVFKAVTQAVEECVISSLLHSETTVGRDENRAASLADYWGKL